MCLVGFCSTKDFNKPSLKFEPKQLLCSLFSKQIASLLVFFAS